MTKHVETAVVARPEASVALTEIGSLIQMAMTSGVPVETIERLVALKERAEERSAASEFNAALMAFQSECRSIPKNREAKITTKGGGAYGYRYADLDQVARTIRPLLEKHGLSYRWDSKIGEGGLLECICHLSHIAGHSQTAHFVCPTASDAAMSGPQKIGSALTYARRQSLVQALGLTVTDDDDDGGQGEPITDQQALEIEDLVQDSGADRERFLNYMGVPSIPEIRACDYERAVAGLRDKLRKKGGAS